MRRALSVVSNAGRPLWNVDNVEAHVRASLDAALKGAGADLDSFQYMRAFAYFWELCWELSGLEDDGVTPRSAWEVRGFLAPRSPLEQFDAIELQQFTSRQDAELVLAELRASREVVLASIAQVRPTGAYDPSKGPAFSTYSRRMITLRLPDWYRSDPEFGDNRYHGSRLEREVSLEALAAQRPIDDDAGDFLERRSPGCRLDVVDDLNRHAYEDSLEEVLMRATASG